MRPVISYGDAARLFTYEPTHGALRWRIDRGYTVKAGDEAGSLTTHGTVAVRVGKQVVQGHYLAWLLHYGEWPQWSLKLAGRKDDLSIDNISEIVPLNPERNVRQREYNAAWRARQRERKYLSMQNQVPYVHGDVSLAYSILEHLWILSDGQVATSRDPHLRRVIGRYASERQALQAAQQHVDRLNFVLADPPPTPFQISSEPQTNPTAPGGLGLYQARQQYCYNPETGDILYRDPALKRALSAITLSARGRPLVTRRSEHYPAAMFAWFLANGEWPKARNMAQRNGDVRDLRLANLYRKDRPDVVSRP